MSVFGEYFSNSYFAQNELYKSPAVLQNLHDASFHTSLIHTGLNREIETFLKIIYWQNVCTIRQTTGIIHIYINH